MLCRGGPKRARPLLLAAVVLSTALVVVGSASLGVFASHSANAVTKTPPAAKARRLGRSPPPSSIVATGMESGSTATGVRPAQTDDIVADLEVATGDSVDVPLIMDASPLNAGPFFGEGVAAGDGASLASPTFLDFGELAPGQYNELDTTIQAPDSPGQFELVWEVSCYAEFECTLTPPVWIIDIDVVSADDTNPVASTLSVSCAPTSIQQDDWTYCQATVTGSTDVAPTGAIFWSTDSGTGDFDLDYCILEGGTCASYYTDSTVGTAAISADYDGDANNLGSSSSPVDVTITSSPLTSPTVLVGCDPTSIYAGGTTGCTASVGGTNPTGSIFWESSSNDYTTSAPSCQLSGGSCGVDYADATVGTSTIYAYYSGDSNNLPGAGTTELAVEAGTSPTTTSLACDPSGISLGDESDCTATVAGDDPTGTVFFSASPALGQLDPLTCVLDDGSCDVDFTGALPGTVLVNASYSGDDLDAGSWGTALVTIAPSTTTSTTKVVCTPSHPQTNASVSCVATVKGSKPTGTVAWSSASLEGSFNADTCALSTGSGARACSVTFVPTAAGSGDVTAAYLGDAKNSASSGSAKLVVHAPPKYTVTVTESGLPASTEWWFNLTGLTSHHATSTSLTVQEPNGSYPYTLGSENKKYDARGGTLTVSGAAVAVTATFAPVNYTITFKESGLPTGAEWWVNITGGASYHSTSAKISVTETNGSYSYTVSTSRAGYTAPSGSVKVDGAAVTKKIAFTS